MATASLAPVFIFRPLDSSGSPMPGGKVYTYGAGTLVPLATYTDQSGTTPAANPLILDANGQTALWLGASSYKINVTDSAGVQQPGYPKDNIISTGQLIAVAVGALQTSIANPTVTTGAAMVGSLLTRDTGTAVTGSTPRTQAAKNFDYPSVKDLGSKGDSTGTIGSGFLNGTATDNSISLQAAFTSSEARTLTVPAGDYLFKTAVTCTAPNVSGLLPSTRFTMRGADKTSTRFVSNLVASTTTYAWNFVGDQSNSSGETYTTISDLSMICGKWDKSNSGLRIYGQAYITAKDLLISGYDTGMLVQGVLSSSFYGITCRYNGDGVTMDAITGVTDCNAVNFNGCSFSNNSRWGFKGLSIGSSLTFLNCRWEANGPKQADGVTNLTPTTATGSGGGFYGSFDGANGTAGPSFHGCYFEGNASSLADIHIVNTSATPMSVTITGCTFNRISSNYFISQNIHVESPGGGLVRVFLAGNSFLSGIGYTPNIAYPFIYHDNNTEIIDGGGNTYSETVSLGSGVTWQYAPTHGVTSGGMVQGSDGSAPLLANNLWLSAKTGTGVYTVTNQGKGWGLGTNSYIAQATAMGAGTTKVLSVVQNTNKVFTVYTANAAGTATNADFSFTVLRLA